MLQDSTTLNTQYGGTVASHTSAPHSHSNKMPCYDYFLGACSHGEKCFFSHDPQCSIAPSVASPFYSAFPYGLNPSSINYKASFGHMPQLPRSNRTSFSNSISPSSPSSISTSLDSDDAGPCSSSGRSQRSSRAPSRSGSRKSLTKKKPQRHRYGEGSAEAFAYWRQTFSQAPYYPIPNPTYFPSDAVREAHLRLKAVESLSPTASSTTGVEKYILRQHNEDEAGPSMTSESSSVPSPLFTEFSLPIPPSPFDPTVYARPPAEVIDFDAPEDEDKSASALALDASVPVETYQCSRVGVLGGGVMLGSARRFQPGVDMVDQSSKRKSSKTMDVTTKTDVLDDDSDEMSGVEYCTTETVSACPLSLSEPTSSERPPVDNRSPELPRARAFSWADSMDDDDSFLDEPLFTDSSSSSTETVLQATPTPNITVSAPSERPNVWFQSNRPAALTLAKQVASTTVPQGASDRTTPSGSSPLPTGKSLSTSSPMTLPTSPPVRRFPARHSSARRNR